MSNNPYISQLTNEKENGKGEEDGNGDCIEDNGD